MFDLGDIGEKIGELAGQNVGDAVKNIANGAAGDNSDEFNKLVQELISKVTSKVGNLSIADNSSIEGAINSVIGSVDIGNIDKGKLVAAIKQGIEILKQSLQK